MRRRIIFGSFILVMACSSSGSDFKVQEVSADQACTDYADAVCELLNKCSQATVQIAFGDLATCKKRFVINCPKTFQANGTSATPPKMEQCKLDAAGLACDKLFANEVPKNCLPEPGKLVDGSACGDDSQCVSTFCSRKGDVCGVCSKAISAGDACAKDGGGFLGSGDCGRGLVCANKICVKPKLKDETCDPKTSPCVTGLSCYGGKCVPGAKGGEKCDDAETAAPRCDTTQPLFCYGLGAGKVCKAVSIVAAGEKCGLVAETFVACSASGFCQGLSPPLKLQGTCIAPAADGGTCNTESGPNCLPPARCVSGQCKLPDPTTCK